MEAIISNQEAELSKMEKLIPKSKETETNKREFEKKHEVILVCCEIRQFLGQLAKL